VGTPKPRSPTLLLDFDGQTHRRTDGRTDGQTPGDSKDSAYAWRRTVKIGRCVQLIRVIDASLVYTLLHDAPKCCNRPGSSRGCFAAITDQERSEWSRRSGRLTRYPAGIWPLASVWPTLFYRFMFHAHDPDNNVMSSPS